MCGRYGRRGNKQKVAEAFQVATGIDEVDFEESFDCAPGSMQPVVSISQQGDRQLRLMRWGFKLPDRLLFNLRSEGVATAKFWKDKFQHQRCIVPATSYFEWQHTASKTKLKFEIDVRHPGHSSNGYFGIAGVWSSWKNPRTELWEDTFSTLTSEPNAVIAKIHKRQPVILESADVSEWLSASERPPVHLLRITPEDRLVVTPASAAESIPANAKSPVMRGLFEEPAP